MGYASDYTNEMVTKALTGIAAFTAPTEWWVILASGNPGPLGTSNIIAGISRQEITSWSWNGTADRAESDNAVEFSGFSGSGNATWAVVFDASSGGNALWYGELVAPRAFDPDSIIRLPVEITNVRLVTEA